MLPYLNALGDSITASGQGGGVKWPQLVADTFGLDLWNPSVSGEASADIAFRSGALVPRVTLEDNEIPASGSVTVTAISPSSGWRSSTGAGYTGQIGNFTGVEIDSIRGTLTHDQSTGTWTFTRDAAGSSVPVTPATPAYMPTGAARRNGVWIFWPGRNDPTASLILRDLRTMTSFVHGDDYLVLSVLNTSGEPKGSAGYNNIISINQQLAATYGDHYVDVRSDLIANGLTDNGLTATVQDTTDISNDVIPSSLRADDTHPNRAGITAIADDLEDVISSKDWEGVSR